MTERATGMSWEALMQAHVFTDMEAAGFGWGATPDRPNQPRGHYAENDSYRPQEFGEYELGAYIAPAGDVHMSITDLAAFATMHLSGLAGRDGAISAETIQYLHSTDPEQEPGYACGWMVVKSENVVKHAHGGSAGTMLAHLEVYPDSGRAIAITMNVGLEGMGAVQEIVAMINERWAAADPVANSTR
jgi:CubicO group peptidase (beta-lactamase class C family)